MQLRPVHLAIGGIVVGAMIGAIAQPHKPTNRSTSVAASSSPTPTTSTMPSYCADKAATWGLPECGWTPEKQAKRDAAEAKRKADDAAFFRYLQQQAKSACDRPIGQIKPDEIEDCERPGNRWLREQ